MTTVGTKELCRLFPNLIDQVPLFQAFSRDDILIVEEVVASSLKRPTDGMEARLVGWEPFASDYGTYDF